MDARVLAICGVTAGFLMCVAAFAGSINMARSRMLAVAASPICRPGDKIPAAARKLQTVTGSADRSRRAN